MTRFLLLAVLAVVCGCGDDPKPAAPPANASELFDKKAAPKSPVGGGKVKAGPKGE